MVFIFSLLLSVSAWAQDYKADRQQFLKEFSKDPAKASQALPLKYNSRGERLSKPRTLFPATEASNRQFVVTKDESRQLICKNAKPGQPCEKRSANAWAGFERDEVNRFLRTNEIERNLERLESLGLHAGQTELDPWSGDYWATANGGIAARPFDPNFPLWKPFNEILDYLGHQGASSLSGALFPQALSPAEKYDLLMNDSQWTLTHSVLLESNKVWRRDGRIEQWFGICHGWASASFMMKRPRRPVDIQLPGSAVTLTFTPDDLKALASHVWAFANYPQDFIGGRCNDKQPATDEKGRVISRQCFEVNPGSWHLAVLHQLGLQKKTFTMDATYDYEVWNQPLVSYNYSFFNPLTNSESMNFREAIIPLKSYANDPYSSYRDPRAVAVVGVSMLVRYVKEVTPTLETWDGPERDNIVGVQYFYDLEIDAEGNIVGGEWYQQAHPDFLWKPAMETAVLDGYLNQRLDEPWTQALPPASWTERARESSKAAQPLYRVINELINRAQ